jgi:hypothetical protein
MGIHLLRSLRGLRRARPLGEHEREFLLREFGSSLSLDKLRMAGGGQPLGRIAWQPMAACMQFADACFERGLPERELQPQFYPILAHEALHVWQRVHRHCALHVSVDGLWLGVVRGRKAYAYDRTLVDAEAVLRHFLTGNIERQGQMFEDYVRSNVDHPTARDPRFAALAHYVRNQVHEVPMV